MTGFYGEHSKVFVSVDCIVFGFDNDNLKLLIGHRQMDPGRGEWSLYGGFVGEDESLEEAASRVLYTLTGLEDIYMKQVGAFGAIDRDPGERVITVAYCFPMRAIDWLHSYKEKYDRFLHTGNPATDAGNAILLHSEGDGSDLPSFLVVENAEEVAAAKAAMQATASAPSQPASGTAVPPAIPGMASTPPPIIPVSDIKLFIAVGGQQYGPYGMDLCRQMVTSGHLTPQSTVWMEGLPTWTQAGLVPALQPLFAPSMPPSMPPLPPMSGPTPPPLG